MGGAAGGALVAIVIIVPKHEFPGAPLLFPGHELTVSSDPASIAFLVFGAFFFWAFARWTDWFIQVLSYGRGVPEDVRQRFYAMRPFARLMAVCALASLVWFLFTT